MFSNSHSLTLSSTPPNHPFIPQLKRCLEQKRFRRRSRFGHYHADPTFAFNNSSFVIQHTPPATAAGIGTDTTGTGTTPAAAGNDAAAGTATTSTPVTTGTVALSSASTSTIATTTPGALRSLPRNRSYFAYRAMAMEIQAADYFLPKGRASLYPPFGQSSGGWMMYDFHVYMLHILICVYVVFLSILSIPVLLFFFVGFLKSSSDPPVPYFLLPAPQYTCLSHVIDIIGMMSSHRHQWPSVVKGEDGLYIGKTQTSIHYTSYLTLS